MFRLNGTAYRHSAAVYQTKCNHLRFLLWIILSASHIHKQIKVATFGLGTRGRKKGTFKVAEAAAATAAGAATAVRTAVETGNKSNSNSGHASPSSGDSGANVMIRRWS